MQESTERGPQTEVQTNEPDGGSVKAKSEKPKQKKKKGIKKGQEKTSGDSRTLFRTAYRTQLDLTQLADNKASIMISVNGFILTIILASGSFIIGSEPRLIMPFAVLLLTCLISMIYAVLSARPRRADTSSTADPIAEKRRNLLFYEDFGRMGEDAYAAAMQKLVSNPRRANEEMSRHIFSLGCVLSKKFRLLRISYSVFIAGLTVSILVFLGLGVLNAGSELRGQSSRPEPSRFSAIYEPSGVVQLPDGRILVVEDEVQNPFTLLSFSADGSLSAAGLEIEAESELDDLEGLAVDARGFVYAVTSHSRDEKGRSEIERQRLMRFRVDADRITEQRLVENLEGAIVEALPVSADEAEEILEKGINIEGLAYDSSGARLLVGLRSPLIEGHAVVVALAHTDRVFEEGESPRFEPAILLDLGREGIRGFSYHERVDGYLIVSGPTGSQRGPFGLWLWSGHDGDAPSIVIIAGALPLESTEGIAPIIWKGKQRILTVSDDGRRKDRNDASYLLLEYDQLSTSSGSPLTVVR